MMSLPLRRRSLSFASPAPVRIWIGAAMVAAAIISLPGGALSADAELRQKALDLVNESRRDHGLEPLRQDAALDTAAQRHAEDMLEQGYFSHTSPEGTSVLDRFRTAGGSESLMVAENIGRCGSCSPPATAVQIEDLHEGWMESPGHRRNILSEGFNRFGFGFAIDKVTGLHAVQTFAGPGTPRAGESGQVHKAVSPAEAAEIAVDKLNQVRQRQGLEPVQLSQPLSRAAEQALSDARETGELALGNVRPGAALERATASGSGDWRSLSTVGGECGGCGETPTNVDVEHFIGQWLSCETPTNVDVEHFIGQWLSNPQYSDHLLAPEASSLGFALAADGTGRKVALALIASR